jgi:ADP-heptose:LPS heptosyltransferase
VTRRIPRILIIRCGLLGDTIDSTAVVRPLVEYYGNDLKIEWLIKPHLKDLFKYDSRISPLILRFTKLPLLLNFGKLKIIIKSYLNPYDAVINLEVGKKFYGLVKLIRSEVKIGYPYNHVDLQYAGEHRVNHQLRIIKSYFKELKIDKEYPYMKGSNVVVEKEYNLKRRLCCYLPNK